jgi:hypothetical protein
MLNGKIASAACVTLLLFLCDISRGKDALEVLTQPTAGFTAQRVSSYDVTGDNSDAFSGIAPGETRVLAEIDGPGMITHIWCTINAEDFYGRKVVLRMFWDDEEDPSVLSPLNDFFCMGHGIDAPLASLPVTTTAAGRAKNVYFKMPFNRKARIEITNEGLDAIGAFYFYIDYRKYEKPLDGALYFHARYRQEYPAKAGEDYLVCSAKRRGHYVGTVLSYESNYAGWWGEGDDKFYIDGETTPSLHGTGTEDYLNDAWGIWKGSSPFYGTSIFEGTPYIYPKDTRYTSYRFHITDMIPFKDSLRFTVEHYGVGPVEGGGESGFMERFDNISSVAYWYQDEPHTPMEALPPVHERLPREAKSHSDLLKFIFEARQPHTVETIKGIREQYAAVADSPTTASYAPRLTAVMASAEISAGNNKAAMALLRDSVSPFVSRDIAREPGIPTLLGERITSFTPLLVKVDDGAVNHIEINGKPAVQTDYDNKSHYIYFAVPGDSPLRNGKTDLELEITYFSTGKEGDTFRVHYDASAAAEDADAYKSSEAVIKSAARGWHTVRVKLPGATLSGKQNAKADFRISDERDGAEIVGSVDVMLHQ